MIWLVSRVKIRDLLTDCLYDWIWVILTDFLAISWLSKQTEKVKARQFWNYGYFQYSGNVYFPFLRKGCGDLILLNGKRIKLKQLISSPAINCRYRVSQRVTFFTPGHIQISIKLNFNYVWSFAVYRIVSTQYNHSAILSPYAYSTTKMQT